MMCGGGAGMATVVVIRSVGADPVDEFGGETVVELAEAAR